MNTNEMLTLKINLLGGMDAYIRENFDSDTIILWNIVLGIPVDREPFPIELKMIADNSDEWARVCAYFGTLVRTETF